MVPETQEGVTEQETPRLNEPRPHRRQVKAKPASAGGGGGGGGFPTLPLQSGQEEQIQTITLQPVSLVKAAGIGDAGGQRED